MQKILILCLFVGGTTWAQHKTVFYSAALTSPESFHKEESCSLPKNFKIFVLPSDNKDLVSITHDEQFDDKKSKFIAVNLNNISANYTTPIEVDIMGNLLELARIKKGAYQFPGNQEKYEYLRMSVGQKNSLTNLFSSYKDDLQIKDRTFLNAMINHLSNDLGEPTREEIEKDILFLLKNKFDQSFDLLFRRGFQALANYYKESTNGQDLGKMSGVIDNLIKTGDIAEFTKNKEIIEGEKVRLMAKTLAKTICKEKDKGKNQIFLSIDPLQLNQFSKHLKSYLGEENAEYVKLAYSSNVKIARNTIRVEIESKSVPESLEDEDPSIMYDNIVKRVVASINKNESTNWNKEFFENLKFDAFYRQPDSKFYLSYLDPNSNDYQPERDKFNEKYDLRSDYMLYFYKNETDPLRLDHYDPRLDMDSDKYDEAFTSKYFDKKYERSNVSHEQDIDNPYRVMVGNKGYPEGHFSGISNGGYPGMGGPDHGKYASGGIGMGGMFPGSGNNGYFNNIQLQTPLTITEGEVKNLKSNGIGLGPGWEITPDSPEFEAGN